MSSGKKKKPKRSSLGSGSSSNVLQSAEWILDPDQGCYFHTSEAANRLLPPDQQQDYVKIKPGSSSGVVEGPLSGIARKEVTWSSLSTSESFVFMSESLMLTAGFKFGDFLNLESGSSGIRTALRVYPHSAANTAHQILVLKESLKRYDDCHVKLSKIRSVSWARSAVLEANLSEERVEKRWILERIRDRDQDCWIVFLGSPLHVSIYGKDLKIQVKQLDMEDNALKGEDEISHRLSGLDLDNASPSPFGLLTHRTQILLRDPSDAQDNLIQESSKDDEKEQLRIGGMDREIDILKRSLSFLSRKQIDTPRVKAVNGILLWGVPGSGKTLLGRSLAKILDGTVNLVEIKAVELMSKFYGESEGLLRSKIEEARVQAPCVVFIDDLDRLCPQQDSESAGQARRLIPALAAALDEANQDQQGKLMFVVASSRPESIDKMLRRAGRIDLEIEIPVPDAKQRSEILGVHLRDVEHSLSPKDIREIAQAAHGYVGADLQALVLASEPQGDENKDGKVTSADLKRALNRVKPSAMREVQIEVPNVSWADIGGLDKLKLSLRQAVEWPIKHPEDLARFGITAPKGVLMYGPPGCSKTMIAKALANESGLNFLSIKGPELFSKWVGESERAVRDLFRKARQVAPAIIFFDEIDALGSQRGGDSGGGAVGNRVLAMLLTEMDGIEALKDVTIVAATNRPDMMDKALIRPGRLDRLFYVPLPDAGTRHKVLEVHTRRKPLGEDVDLSALVELTEGYSGAEIASVCNEAALKALEEDITAVKIHPRHFEQALLKVQPRIKPEFLKIYDQFQKRK